MTMCMMMCMMMCVYGQEGGKDACEGLVRRLGGTGPASRRVVVQVHPLGIQTLHLRAPEEVEDVTPLLFLGGLGEAGLAECLS